MRLLHLLLAAALAIGSAWLYLRQTQGAHGDAGPSGPKAQLDSVREKTHAAEQQTQEKLNELEQRMQRETQ